MGDEAVCVQRARGIYAAWNHAAEAGWPDGWYDRLSDGIPEPSECAGATHARDIPDGLFLAVATALQGPDAFGAARGFVAEALQVPEEVVLAKAKRLVKQGLIDGCVCGCRGDWSVRAAC